jgi:succinyl-diaminopimelate desuccinylase
MRFISESDRQTLRSWMNELVGLPTFREDGVNDDQNFNEAIRDGFEWLEGWAEQRDFEVRNWDNKVLEITGGTGREVALAVHLDVVPFSEDDWETGEPNEFHLHEDDETVYYGRGVIDDKGPLAAIMMAIDRLQSTDSLPVRFRLIVDSAEEVGFERIRNYFEKTDANLPRHTLVADGFFPMVAGEKGLLQADLTIEPDSTDENSEATITRLTAGDAYNQVPARATAVLDIGGLDTTDFQDLIRKKATSLAIDVSVERDDSSTVTIVAKGDTAHGSSPDEGLNAGAGLIKLLAGIDEVDLEHRAILSGLADALTGEDGRFRNDASGFELAAEDERFVQGTTSNLGTLRYSEDGTLTLGLDFRLVPSTSTDDAVRTLKNWFPESLPDDCNVTVNPMSSEPPLLVDTGEPLPEAALEAYETVRGNDPDPVYMGGRTHAAALEHAFAFGCMEADRFESYGFHGADEQVPETELLEAAEIYAETLEVYGARN